MYYIVGNKCDLDDGGGPQREVSYEEGEQWVEDYKEEFCDEDDEIDIKFIEVSAKNGTNIGVLFSEIAVKLIEKHNKVMGIKYGANSSAVLPSNPNKNQHPHANNNYDNNRSIVSQGQGGPGANRIEIIDINNKFRDANKNKGEKSGCCASC